MSRASEGTATVRTSSPAACAFCSWRARLPGPKAGPNTPGGEISRALVPLPWRSGTIVTERAGRGR